MGKRNMGSLVGERFGKLVVVELAEVRRYAGYSKTYWRCVCECGGTVDVQRSNLTTGHTTSCACMYRDVEFGGLTMPRRIAEKIERQETGCWIWTGEAARGYGRVGWSGRSSYGAHRAVYEIAKGKIPEGAQIDHVRLRGCTSTLCVNPEHLEAVSPKENVRRSAVGDAQRARTHCPKGHAYDDANTYIDRRGHRGCKACIRAAGRVCASKRRAGDGREVEA